MEIIPLYRLRRPGLFSGQWSYRYRKRRDGGMVDGAEQDAALERGDAGEGEDGYLPEERPY